MIIKTLRSAFRLSLKSDDYNPTFNFESFVFFLFLTSSSHKHDYELDSQDPGTKLGDEGFRCIVKTLTPRLLSSVKLALLKAEIKLNRNLKIFDRFLVICSYIYVTQKNTRNSYRSL